jgi:hypothetical protein
MLDRPGGQLEHARRVGDLGRDATGRETAYEGDDAVGVVEEDDVDRVAHPEHVHLAAGADPEAVAGGQAASAEQPAEPCPVRVRGAQPLDDDAAGRQLAYAKGRTPPQRETTSPKKAASLIQAGPMTMTIKAGSRKNPSGKSILIGSRRACSSAR